MLSTSSGDGAAGARPLRGARAAHLPLPLRGRTLCVASDPIRRALRRWGSRRGPELARADDHRLAIPMVAPRPHRALSPMARTASSRRAIASQVAVGTEGAGIAHSREEPDQGFLRSSRRRTRGDSRAAIPNRLRPRPPHVGLVAEPCISWPARPPAAPGSRISPQDSLRALVRLTSHSSEPFVARLRRIHAELAQPVSVGVSSVCQGEETFADGFAEAQQALVGTVVLSSAPAVLAYDDLGAYKYLLRVAVDRYPRRNRRRGRKLAESSAARSQSSDARGVPAPARVDPSDVGGAVLPNTLRQRSGARGLPDSTPPRRVVASRAPEDGQGNRRRARNRI